MIRGVVVEVSLHNFSFLLGLGRESSTALEEGSELRAGPCDAGGAVRVDGVAGQRMGSVRPQGEPLHQLHREEEELLRQ